MNNLSKKEKIHVRYNFLSDDVMKDMDLIDILLKFDSSTSNMYQKN